MSVPMEEQQAKKLIESLKPLQEDTEPDGYIFPCPRCGRRMNPKPVRNAISRYADVYICSECGRDEALLDITGKPPLPFVMWSMVLSFAAND